MHVAAFTAAWWPAELATRVGPWVPAVPASCIEPVALSDGCACDTDGCDLPPEPFAGPILPFYRFLERENRIARRVQAEADVARAYARRAEADLGSRIDVLA